MLAPIESAIRHASGHRKPTVNPKNGVCKKITHWVWGAVKHGVLFPVGWLVINCFSMGWSEGGGVNSVNFDQRDKVPTFYAGTLTGSHRLDGLRCGVAATVIATTFGGIHCIAWSFAFASRAEQMLWRISSMIIVCVPTLYLMSWGILKLYLRSGRRWLPSQLLEKIFVIWLLSTAFLYGAARIMLLVYPFVSLRSLSPGAYQAVYWTSFIPHF